MKIINIVDDELARNLELHQVGVGDWLLLKNLNDVDEYLVIVCQVAPRVVQLISITDHNISIESRSDANRMCEPWKWSGGSLYFDFNHDDKLLISMTNKNTTIQYKVYKLNVDICVYYPQNLEDNRII